MNRRAFSLVELLVTIAVIALLFAISFPVLASVRAASRRTACLSNVRQIVAAVAAESASNGGRLPENRVAVGENEHVTWRHRLAESGLGASSKLWVCPDHPGKPRSELDDLDRGSRCVGDVESSYAINGHLLWRLQPGQTEAVRADTTIRRPSHTILLAETRARYPDIRVTNAIIAADDEDGRGFYGFWHAGAGTYGFSDGHAETIRLLETGSPDCRWHNGPDYDADPNAPQDADELGIHAHEDWPLFANDVYLSGTARKN